MRKKLLIQALSKFLLGVLALMLLVFVPAGTLHYPNGWLLMAVLFLPMLAAGVVMLWKAPALLEKRMRTKEQQGEQRQVVAWSSLMFVGGFVLAGLDFRFGWSDLPGWLPKIAAAVLLLSYGLYVEVMRENAYLSRTVEVQEGQKVVDTGMYAVVRHPMYAVTVVLFLSMPLVLGSLWAFLLFLVYPMLLVKRIQNEEQVLREGLPGYEEYTQKVRWRMIPLIW